MSVFRSLYAAALLFGVINTASIAGEFQSCASVPATGQNCPGERHPCGEGCVKCGTVTVGAPAGQSIISVQSWGSPRGWWAWEQSPAVSGNLATGRAKNWSDNQALDVCIKILTQ